MKENLKTYVNMIKSDDIRNNTSDILNKLPDYFWSIPASSGGKYHPLFAACDGGLVWHTIAAVRIAIDLFRIYPFTTREEDVVLSALILHDGLKLGNPKQRYTRKDHPKLMSDFILEKYPEMVEVAGCVKSHMGQWAKPVPKTELQKFTHLCDYLASRKQIDIDFNLQLKR